MPPTDATLVRLLDSCQARQWLDELVPLFFQPQPKRELLDRVRSALPELMGELAPPEREQLTDAFIGHLCRQASVQARTPSAPPSLPTGPELAQRIVGHYPFPIAGAYQVLTEADSPAAEFGCLMTLFETTIHYLASVAVSAYLRTELNNAECNEQLLGVLLRDKWSTGVLFGLFRDTVRLAGGCAGRLPYPELPEWLFNRHGKRTEMGAVLESFVELRNTGLGHAGNRSDRYCELLVESNRPRLEGVLASMPWLAGSQLLRPIELNDGRVVRADLFLGTTRLRRQRFGLALEEADLDPHTGDVRADRNSLLLLRQTQRYLSLFPLAQYGMSGKAFYFLHGLDWSSVRPFCRLRRATYLGYNIDDPQKQRHEEQTGDFAAACLERHIGRLLELSPGEDGAVPAPPAVQGDPDLTLPEVLVEQQSHLAGFAGREELLTRLAAWIDAKAEGGYLLLLGPPGQGKSALLSRLAEQEGKRGGGLLHLVKSHRNPLRFVPSLISQAAQLAQTTFGSSAYEGDVDDLRNSLVKAVEAVRGRTGRAVVVLDALDELESGGSRIGFLPPRLPEGVRVVLSCRPDIPLVTALRARLRGSVEEWPVPALSADDFRCLVERRLEAGAVRALADQVSFDELFDRMGGNPLCLCCFVDDVAGRWQEASQSGKPLQLDLARVPATLDAVFRDVCDRVRQKVQGQPVTQEGRQRAKILALLSVAREPLSVEQLCELMEVLGERLFLEEGQDRLEEMSQWLLESSPGRFKPWHQGLADHVRERVLGGSGSGVRQMEDVFCRWLEAEAAARSLYGLRHRLGHLLAARRVEEAVTRLLDRRWLEAKTESGLVFELAADFTRLLGELPREHPRQRMLELVEEALRRDIHFLLRHPACLFQCLWNSGWWYDCPAGAGHYVEGRSPGAEAGVGLHHWLKEWQTAKEQESPWFVWLRSLRPPAVHLGTAQKAVFRGHEKWVRSVSYSPDGLRIVSGSWDTTVRVWDASSGAQLLCLRGHEREVSSVSYSSDGLRIVSGSGDKTVRVWDAASGAQLLCLRGHEKWVRSVSYSPDGLRIVSGSDDNTVRVWDASSGAQLLCLRGHEREVSSVSYSSDGLRIVSGSWDNTVRVWDQRTRRCVCGMRAAGNASRCSRDGQT
jgi:hypothetical protein